MIFDNNPQNMMTPILVLELMNLGITPPMVLAIKNELLVVERGIPRNSEELKNQTEISLAVLSKHGVIKQEGEKITWDRKGRLIMEMLYRMTRGEIIIS